MGFEVPRLAENEFERLLDLAATNFNVILVEGARQTGKTTMIRRVLHRRGHYEEFNLETNAILRERVDSTKSFLEFKEVILNSLSKPPSDLKYVFIDEAQESSQIGSYVRSLKEEWPKFVFILSGSSMKRLFRANTRVPVGRILRIKVTPFNYSEFLYAHGKEALTSAIENFDPKESLSPTLHEIALEWLDKYLLVGGLPDVVLSHSRAEDYVNLRRTILLSQRDDFVRKERFEQAYLFMEAMRGVANHLGFPSKTTHVCDKYEDAKKVLAVLSQWHLILEIEQRTFASTSRLYPKRYLYDMGVAHEVRAMPFPDLSTLKTLDAALRTQLGGLFENFVALAIDEAEHGLGFLSGWQKSSRDRTEVDFVWKLDAPVPIEVKAKLRVTPRDFSNLKKYLELSKLNLGILVSAAPFAVFREKGVYLVNLPGYLFQKDVVDRILMHFTKKK